MIELLCVASVTTCTSGESGQAREQRWRPRDRGGGWEQMHTNRRGGEFSKPGLQEPVVRGRPLEAPQILLETSQKGSGTRRIFALSSRLLVLEILTFLLPSKWGGAGQKNGDVVRSTKAPSRAQSPPGEHLPSHKMPAWGGMVSKVWLLKDPVLGRQHDCRGWESTLESSPGRNVVTNPAG